MPNNPYDFGGALGSGLGIGLPQAGLGGLGGLGGIAGLDGLAAGSQVLPQGPPMPDLATLQALSAPKLAQGTAGIQPTPAANVPIGSPFQGFAPDQLTQPTESVSDILASEFGIMPKQPASAPSAPGPAPQTQDQGKDKDKDKLDMQKQLLLARILPQAGAALGNTLDRIIFGKPKFTRNIS